MRITKNSLPTYLFKAFKRFYAVVSFQLIKFCIYPVGNYRLYNHCGDNSLKDPPVLIPNTEVKLQRAESTCRVTCREDRSLPHSTSTVHFERCFFISFLRFSLWSVMRSAEKAHHSTFEVIQEKVFPLGGVM